MAEVEINGIGSRLGTQLQQLLQAEDIVAGSAPSYQLCKTIYAYHPLGAKIAEKPIKLAQSQAREITIQKGPEDRLREAYDEEWKRLNCDKHIFNTMTQARVYGVTSLAILIEKQSPATPLDLEKLWDAPIAFNVFDPLNTAGSLVLNQDPNAVDFQKVSGGISVQGTNYHRSRCVTMMNENPLYIEYTSSGFGYVGRSCYQRALFPLKSFIQSMVTDDMVTRKAGLLVAFIKGAGSILNNLMKKAGEFKRSLLQMGVTDNVLQVGQDDKVTALDMTNIGEAYGMARGNVLDNIASAVPMPALLLKDETYAEGFGEGTEDAKATALFIDDVRKDMNPLYAFMDMIVKRRAWNPEFYKIIQEEFPDYKSVSFNRAFYDWENSFSAKWPSLLKEPPSEEVKVDAVKLQAIIDLLLAIKGDLDPFNRAEIIKWAQDNFNSLKMLFDANLSLDFVALVEHFEDQADQMQQMQEAGAQANEDGAGEHSIPGGRADAHESKLGQAVLALPDRSKPKNRERQLKRA